MIICKVSCPIYSTCQDRDEWKRCIFDLGISPSEGDNRDDFLEKVTY